MKLTALFGFNYLLYSWKSWRENAGRPAWPPELFNLMDTYARNFVDHPRGLWDVYNPSYKFNNFSNYVTSDQLYKLIELKITIYKQL